MRIKTHLWHEANGGYTNVMFSEPILKKKNFGIMVYVNFCIVKYRKKAKDSLWIEKCFHPELLKSQKKRILNYAKKLADVHVKDYGLKIIKKGTLSINGNGSYCVFYTEKGR